MDEIVETAQQRWGALDGKRRGIINRCEVYAAWTLPKICPPVGYKQESEELPQDFQSVGAQCVNHLSNKMMLALFAPSRPFFRLDATPSAQAAIAAAGAPLSEIQQKLGEMEKEAIASLDRKALRPKLYEVLKHLIITGNVLMWLGPVVRVIGIKHFCVRRSMTGKLIEIVMKDSVQVDELEQATKTYVMTELHKKPSDEVCLYRHIKWNGTEYIMTQSIESIVLPADRFNGKYTEDTLPFRVLTWDLTDGMHYGTGLVEDYSSDFEGLSKLSVAQIQNAILASEFRWLVNPAGMTSVEELTQSENGSALAGAKDDIHILETSKGGELQTIGGMITEYVNRLGRAFLLASALVRQAERVTAEEIRQTADELETALGGGYSRIAVDFQGPLANWLLAGLDIGLGTDLQLTVITGLDALSRNGDLEDLKLWLADMAGIAALPPPLLARLKLDVLATALALPRRIDVSAYFKSDAEVQAEQQQAMEQQGTMMAAQAGADAASKAPPPTQGQ